jgi:cellulose synthase/poly-beta-1,6-N-acetylglucosamine synthase-like glycosyltransferase
MSKLVCILLFQTLKNFRVLALSPSEAACAYQNTETEHVDGVFLLQRNFSTAKVSRGFLRLEGPDDSWANLLPQTLLEHLSTAAAVVIVPSNTKATPTGSDIWNANSSWVKVSEFHPSGVISNANPFQVVEWNDVSYISLTMLLVLCGVAYPALLIFGLLFLTVLVSMCLVISTQSSADEPDQTFQVESSGSIATDSHMELPVLSKKRLTSASQRLYDLWALFCCSVPSLMVFATPALMVCLARPFPQEVLASLTLLTSAFIFSNGLYVMSFGGMGMLRLRHMLSQEPKRPSSQELEVQHWVLLPQYKEDMDVVSMALRSIAASSVAKTSIGVVLAMEQREQGSKEKAEALIKSFEGQFRDMIATYHPPDLPNDPPGKASNLCWAFKQLQQRVGEGRNAEKVVLTVADADSEFCSGYFDNLSRAFLEADESVRYFRIWQSPVFHVKNYHRQPSPVVVGTMFTSMAELSGLCDPNAVRFPYSTYSLSMNLARRVGGWDQEWIAEDYHMGIKCFLMTYGQVTVEPLLYPTVNYVPEEMGSWWGTCLARWTQAKRHALGFSDISYYFMMLPLVFGYSAAKATEDKSISSLSGFWKLASFGWTLVIRLVNIHVLLGVLTTYALMETALKLVMHVVFRQDRNLNFLLFEMNFFPTFLMTASFGCSVVITLLFYQAYILLTPRIEGKPSVENHFFHWLWSCTSFFLWSPIYFMLLAFATWNAAIGVLTLTKFEYEVAPKPTFKEGREGEAPIFNGA